MNKLKSLLMATLLLGLASCVSTWVRVDDTNRQYTGANFEMNVPEGWMMFAAPNGKGMLLSKDGPDLQRISINYKTHDKAFPELEKSSTADMLPSELAELYIAETKASAEDGLPSLKILRNEPIKIGGKLGFALHLRYKEESGLQYEVLARGFANENGFYYMYFLAPSLHFFDRDRQAFDVIATSFQPTHG